MTKGRNRISAGRKVRRDAEALPDSAQACGSDWENKRIQKIKGKVLLHCEMPGGRKGKPRSSGSTTECTRHKSPGAGERLRAGRASRFGSLGGELIQEIRKRGGSKEIIAACDGLTCEVKVVGHPSGYVYTRRRDSGESIVTDYFWLCNVVKNYSAQISKNLWEY